MFDVELLRNIILIIVGLFTVIWTLIQISSRYKKEKVVHPNIILYYDNHHTVSEDGEITTYYLSAKNVGDITAENVEIRLHKVIQEDNTTSIEDGHIVGKYDYINVGDSHRFNFIHDYVGREDIEDCLSTSAGKDRKLDRENGEYTFIISGKNLPLKTVKMKMEWIENLSKWFFYEVRK